MRKVKRKAEITACVVKVLPDQGYVMLDWGRTFGVSAPAFPVAVGHLVDVAHVAGTMRATSRGTPC